MSLLYSVRLQRVRNVWGDFKPLICALDIGDMEQGVQEKAA